MKFQIMNILQKTFIISTITIANLLFAFTPQIYASTNIINTNTSTKTVSRMLQKAMPSVVNILIQGQLPIINDPFLKKQLQDYHNQLQIQGHKFVALGSGVIINAEKGYIVTNAHVVDHAKKILVTLNDGRRYIAKLIGTDDAYDIALLHIQADNLIALPFANMNKANVGDYVAAIGSPFGLKQTVTSGIISALHRSDIGIEGYENFIQTDASINVGNSGGALINRQGQLIGINTAIVGSGKNGGSVGIGFAIPADIVSNIIKQIAEYGKVDRGVLGVNVQSMTPSLAQSFNLPINTKGALVTKVMLFSGANHAGLKDGDIIIKANGKAVTSASQLRNIVGLIRVNTNINMLILRQTQQKFISAKIKSSANARKELENAEPHLYGVRMRNITAFDNNFGLIEGVEVTNVSYDSMAWISNLRAGDIIIDANHKKVNNIKNLINISNISKKRLLLHVISHQGSFYLVIQ